MSTTQERAPSVKPGNQLKRPERRKGERWKAFEDRLVEWAHEHRYDLALDTIRRQTPSCYADLPLVERRALARAYAHSLGLTAKFKDVSR